MFKKRSFSRIGGEIDCKFVVSHTLARLSLFRIHWFGYRRFGYDSLFKSQGLQFDGLSSFRIRFRQIRRFGYALQSCAATTRSFC